MGLETFICLNFLSNSHKTQEQIRQLRTRKSPRYLIAKLRNSNQGLVVNMNYINFRKENQQLGKDILLSWTNYLYRIHWSVDRGVEWAQQLLIFIIMYEKMIV